MSDSAVHTVVHSMLEHVTGYFWGRLRLLENMTFWKVKQNVKYAWHARQLKICKATFTAVEMSSPVQDPQPLKGKEIAMAFLCAKLASIAAPKVPDDKTDALPHNSST